MQMCSKNSNLSFLFERCIFQKIQFDFFSDINVFWKLYYEKINFEIQKTLVF